MSINSLNNIIQSSAIKLIYYDVLTGIGISYSLLNSITQGIVANVPFTIIASINEPNGLSNFDPPEIKPTVQCSLQINNVNVPYSPPTPITIGIPTAITYTYQCISNVDNPKILVFWQSQYCQFDNTIAGATTTIQILQ